MSIEGLRSSILSSIRSGVNASYGGLPGVARDGTSSKYCPASSGEWTTVMAAAGLATGNPSAAYLFQESSGSPADSIGAFTLTVGGTPTYQTAVTGWTRKAIVYADAATGGMSSASASLPDIAATSVLILAYITMPAAAPAGTRQILSAGSVTAGAGTRIQITNAPLFRAVSGANGANGAADPTNAVRPMVLKHDQTNDVCTVYNDQEKVSATFDTGATDKRICFGGQTSQSTVAGGPLYAAVFVGAAAELSDAQVKILLQTLGFTIPW